MVDSCLHCKFRNGAWRPRAAFQDRVLSFEDRIIYIDHVIIVLNKPLNPPGVGHFLGECQSRIYQHIGATFGRGPTVVSKKGGGMIMKLLQVYQVQYCQQCVNF